MTSSHGNNALGEESNDAHGNKSNNALGKNSAHGRQSNSARGKKNNSAHWKQSNNAHGKRRLREKKSSGRKRKRSVHGGAKTRTNTNNDVKEDITSDEQIDKKQRSLPKNTSSEIETAPKQPISKSDNSSTKKPSAKSSRQKKNASVSAYAETKSAWPPRRSNAFAKRLKKRLLSKSAFVRPPNKSAVAKQLKKRPPKYRARRKKKQEEYARSKEAARKAVQAAQSCTHKATTSPQTPLTTNVARPPLTTDAPSSSASDPPSPQLPTWLPSLLAYAHARSKHTAALTALGGPGHEAEIIGTYIELGWTQETAVGKCDFCQREIQIHMYVCPEGGARACVPCRMKYSYWSSC
jgi:hypothetical protein